MQLHPAGVQVSLEAPRAPVLRVGPGRGFPAAGLRAAPEKQAMQKEKEKKKTMKKKEECAVIFKKARFLLQICICVGKACASQRSHTGGGVSGLRLCKCCLGSP